MEINWAEFFAVPEDASFWTILNSPILVALIAATIGWQLNRRINNVRDDAQAASDDASLAVQVAERHDDSLELELDEAEHSNEHDPDSAEDYREQLRALANEAKARIEREISQDPDKRHQRTYARYNGHHPISRAIALRQRERITAEEEHALITILRTWNRYNKGLAANRVVPKAVFELMRANWDSIQ